MTDDAIRPGKTARSPSVATTYVCPMDPEVRQARPGACPKCGMALEPDVPVAATQNPVDLPDASRDRSRRARCVSDLRHGAGAEDGHGRRGRESRTARHDAALLDERAARRSSGGLRDVAHGPAAHMCSRRMAGTWLEFALATPIVLWCGWPFFERGWASVKFRSPNMFTLIAMGVGVAYVYSAVATIAPANLSAVDARHAWPAGGVLRGCRGHHRPRAAGAGAGASCAQPHQQRHSRVARSLAQAGAHHARRRQRVRRSARAGEGRRQAARASGREDSGGR